MGPSWVMEPSSAPNPGPATACWYLEAWAPVPAGFGCFRLSLPFVTQIFQRQLRFVKDLGKGCIQVTFFFWRRRRNSSVSATQKHTQLWWKAVMFVHDLWMCYIHKYPYTASVKASKQVCPSSPRMYLCISLHAVVNHCNLVLSPALHH